VIEQVKILCSEKGLTFLEILIAMIIMAILAAAILPMSEVTVKRTKEIELRRALREIRTAIDQYHQDFEKAKTEKKIITSIDENGYPEELEELVVGKEWGDLYPTPRKYLRRIPKDPFDRYNDGWGLRSYEDDFDSTVWGGGDIYDVYSTSDAKALDGTYYQTW
jgi:general secretion pathway protein G